MLDLETRLDNIGLGQEVTKATGGRMKLDRSTENLLAFNSSGTGFAAPATQGDTPLGDKPWWMCVSKVLVLEKTLPPRVSVQH